MPCCEIVDEVMEAIVHHCFRASRTLARNRLALLAVVALLGGQSVQADDVYNVGTAVVDITPDYPIRLNGFGNRREESDGVSQRVYAKALAIDAPPPDGQTTSPLVLVALDSLGIRQSLVDEVARRLMQSHRLPAANLAVTFTHSHCTPKVNGASDNIFSQAIPPDHQRHIDRYTSELTDHVTRAAQQALSAMQPAHLDWAVGSVKFAKNRRTVGGPVDHDLPMLVVRDAQTHKPRAIYVSYACHCVTLSFNRISGDWAGYAADMIERRFPGAIAMVSIGAGSDQNPVSGVTGDKVQVAEAQGIEIAEEVNRLLAGDLKRITGPPKSVRNQIDLPLNTVPTRQELLEQTGKGRPTDRYNAVTQLQRLDRGEPLLTQIDYPIQTWTFGDSFCMTFLAGEVCVDYAVRLKQELDRERFWLNAYSNDFCCYIPSERLVAEGGYGGGAEVPYFALPTTLQGGLEQKILDEVRRQVPEEFHVAAGTEGVPPKSPRDSLQCIRTSAELKTVLAATEPHVTDPVAIDFGPDGRLWVAEMNDYGHDVYETFPQTGRVRWLRDRDNDGFFEVAETFIDGLRFPTDVKVWRDGVLICDAPDILLARDEDNDGRADNVTKLFSGFEVRNAQARVNSLRFGLDNWLYGAGGLFGGTIKSLKSGEAVDCTNRDFRIDPDRGVIEAVSGRTQQGRCRNDYGDWFGCSNGTLLTPIASDDDYRKRNPLVAPAAVSVVDVDAEALKLYPPEDLVTFELSGVPGRATSACGLGIYRDVALGPEFLNDAFTCEPVHQSVHRIDFEPGDSAFVGRRGRGEQSREFLSSTDRWFRPVQVRTGPDGALWIVDMYRYVIEHSRWIPQSSLARLDVYAGRGRGRIYRVVARPEDDQEGAGNNERRTSRSAARDSTDSAALRTVLIPDLAALPDDELASRLDSPNGPIRDLAHQLLLWRQAETAAPVLRRVASDSRYPAAQIQALAALDGLKQLSAEDVLNGLRSPHVEVQRHAAKLSERLLNESRDVRSTLIRLASSDNMRLRRQVALSLGAAVDPESAKTIARLLTSGQNSVVRSAALNSVATSNIGQVLREYSALRPADRNPDIWRRLLVLSIRIGNASILRETVTEYLPSVQKLPTGPAAELWLAAFNALDARAAQDQLPDSFDDVEQAARLFRLALATVRSTDRSEAEYRAAFDLLGRSFGPWSQSALTHRDDREQLSAGRRAQALAAFLSARYPAALQEAAIQSVIATGAAEAPELLVSAYPSLNSALRVAVIDALLSRTNGHAALLSAIESKVIRAANLSPDRRDKLLSSPDSTTRSAASKILGSSSDSSRSAVVEAMRGAVELKGSVAQGHAVFRKRCAACHRVEDHGHVVGPDLKALTNRDPQWLLTAILDPNQDVDARYLAWTAVTNDGRTASGMIVEETAGTIRLRESGGKEHLIPRADIEEFRSSQKSVMPEGLERDLSPQDLSDVIAWLGSLASPPKSFPGNKPQVVTLSEDGHLMLTAASAEIRGTHIRFEAPFANIGYWHHQTDSATWRVDLANPGDFDVYLNASCDRAVAGNEFRIDGLPTPITGTVAGTGGWDRYRPHKAGTVTLPAGRRVITVRAASPVKGALFDLREVRLVPAGEAPGFDAADVTDTPLPRYPPEIAPFLLDESQPAERRQQVIDQRPGMGPAIMSLLVSGLEPGDEAEEYRRIPWIWRVAIAVGRRNDGGEIRDLLEITVPKVEQPLRDWQSVVIGGGLINGASQMGLWPRERLDEILNGIPATRAAWPVALSKAAQMADNAQVRSGTRYDALRMVALHDDPQAATQLLRYLRKGTPNELQMGAVSGLVDVDSEDAARALLEALSHLEGRNRQLAIEGLLRTDGRAAGLAKMIAAGRLTLTTGETRALTQHPLAAIRKRFATLSVR